MQKKVIVTTVATTILSLVTLSAFSLTHTKLAIVSTSDSETTITNTTTMNTRDINDQDAAGTGSKKTTTSAITSILTKFIPLASAAEPSAIKTMAWIYPGNPACGASTEYADGRKIDVLKSEFFTIAGGFLTLIDTTNSRCNGYSPATITRLKQYSTEQYATVSSASADDMETFIDSALAPNSTEIATLVDFTTTNNITGIELDFEDFSSWTPAAYNSYKLFIAALGDALHAKGKKLMIDGPAISNVTEENWFVWRYADFATLPVDQIVIMAYDYQYDYGAGAPVAPLDWIKAVITYSSSKYPKEKITIGLPSYGYQGAKGSYRITILTNEQIRKKAGFSTAVRDVRSGEMTWKSGNTVYFYQDTVSLQQKRDAAASMGITSVSVWHLGGNLWF